MASLNFDLTKPSSLQWLMIVSLAVLYNVIFVLGRAVFWELNNSVPWLWWTLDYLCDTIYIADIFVHAHEGILTNYITFLICFIF
jgi:cyclic nucleotide gated channel alpha 3